MSAGISVGESEAGEPVRIFRLIALTFANAHNNVHGKEYKSKTKLFENLVRDVGRQIDQLHCSPPYTCGQCRF